MNGAGDIVFEPEDTQMMELVQIFKDIPNASDVEKNAPGIKQAGSMSFEPQLMDLPYIPIGNITDTKKVQKNAPGISEAGSMVFEPQMMMLI